MRAAVPLYAIKHLPTGRLLSQRDGRWGRRAGKPTFAELRDPGEEGYVPRLFYEERSAGRALTTWLKGRKVHDDEDDPWAGRYERDPSRDALAADMAVVRFDLPLEVVATFKRAAA